ncbi:hypothetical protein FH729_25125, partial [Bacteroides thetaiotaomicron]|nr:hypothetical protein [Bacteroides thetaiotaomicron]
RVGAMLKKPVRWLVVYGALTAAAALMLTQLPTAFLPDEDQGNFMVMVIRPQGTPLAETMQSVREVESYIRKDEPAAYTFALGGF